MIQLNVRYVKFGDWLLGRVGGDAFEVIRLTAAGGAAAVARVSINAGEIPTLAVMRLGGEPRVIERKPLLAEDRVLLADCRQWDRECFRLTAERAGDDLEIMLSGDSRHEAGRKRYGLFWWRVEFGVFDGELVIHGPSLASDPWS